MFFVEHFPLIESDTRLCRFESIRWPESHGLPKRGTLMGLDSEVMVGHLTQLRHVQNLKNTPLVPNETPILQITS
jgi:hypothetical protein